MGDYDYREFEGFNGKEVEGQDNYGSIQQRKREEEEEEDIGTGNESKQSLNYHPHHHNRDFSSSSSNNNSGKLFVGGLSWDTTEETFSNHFSKYGEIKDVVIMMDKDSGKPRGFGFVTFADSAVAVRVLEEDHVIDGRHVEVKKTVPRGDMGGGKGVIRAKKIFIGGIPSSLTEDELQEYFSIYGSVVEHQIILNHRTGRSRGFGFVTFDSEDAVEQIFSEGKTHELGGRTVEIKKAEPKRAGDDYGSASKSYTGFGSHTSGYGANHGLGTRHGGKMSTGFNGHGGYGGYGGHGGGYPGNIAGLYGSYGGYGYGFGYTGTMMYGGGGYGGNAYVNPSGYGGSAGYGGGKGYGKIGESGSFGNGRGYGYGYTDSGGYSSDRGYGAGANGGGAVPNRYHPYRK